MKRITLALAVLCTLVTTGGVFAQERDAVGHRVGPWNMANHPCFQKISWKLRKSYYSDNADNYTNEIEIKNNYGITVTLSFNFTADANTNTTRYRKTLAPNETYTNTYCPNTNMVYMFVTDVCFNNNCKEGCYAQCDNGVPNQPNCDGTGNTTTNANNSSTNAAQPQNNLSAYNQSKANLESQQQQQNQEIANRNAEAQRQQQLLKQQQEQQKQQQLQQNLNQLSTSTADLISILAHPRKRAKNKTLPYEDGQILINLVKVPNPLDYKQKVIDIFTDLGYSFEKEENTEYGGVRIYFTEFHPISTITDYLTVIISPSTKNGEIQNEINLRGETAGKLKKKLACIVDNIDWKYYQDFYIRSNEKEQEATQNNTLLNTELTGEQLFNKGFEFYGKQDFLNAYKYYEEASKKGYAEGMTQIGRLYSDGKGVAKDYNKAMQWYLEAIKNNNTHAMLFIAYLYEDGSGVPKDYGKAMEWLLKASALGDASAMYEIAGLYYEGEDIEQDYAKAMEWYLKSAEKGNKNAMSGIAYSYLKGKGVAKDVDKAKEWFLKACNAGSSTACDELKKL